MSKRSGFADYKTAMAVRDIIRGISKKTIDRERPRPRYGLFVSYDPVANVAQVQFPAEAGTVPVNCGMIVPAQVGCLVRVDRIGNDRYLTDAYGCNEVDVNADLQILQQSAPRGTVTSWTQPGAAAAVATTSETAWFSGIASTAILAGRRYRISLRVFYTPSAVSAVYGCNIFVRLGVGLTGVHLIAGTAPQTCTNQLSHVNNSVVVGGVDIPVGAQVFTISAQAATGTVTCVTGTVPAGFSSQLIVEDIGT